MGAYAESKVLNHVKLLQPGRTHPDKRRILYYHRQHPQPEILLLRPDGKGFVNKYPHQHVVTERRPKPDISGQRLTDLELFKTRKARFLFFKDKHRT